MEQGGGGMETAEGNMEGGGSESEPGGEMSDGGMEGGMEEGEMVMNESDPGMGSSGASQSEAMPDFSEDETLNEALESFEEAMESAAAEAAAQGGQSGGMAGESGGGQPAGGGGQQSGAETPGEYAGTSGAQTDGGDGTLTGAEQVAILDEQLNRGTGDFDDLILRERETIRRTTKNGPGQGEEESAEPAGGGSYGEGGGAGGQFPPMAGGGGGGMGGPGPVPRETYDADIPAQAAVYAPPPDIPDGVDDDVVARQLREAAMREPDPQLREKLWDEYRKYKGID
jgi:hypothetical protein